jgi:hypothetical protein
MPETVLALGPASSSSPGVSKRVPLLPGWAAAVS